MVRFTKLCPSLCQAQHSYLYWVADWGSQIQGASIEDFLVEDVITQPDAFSSIYDVAIDPQSSKIFWTSGAGTIGTASLTGNEVDSLANVACGIGIVTTITIDVSHGKLFRGNGSDCYDAVIQSSSLEEPRSVENLPFTSRAPFDLAVDTLNQKILWTSGDKPGTIMRSDFDGENFEDIPLVSAALTIDVDHVNEEIFWTSFPGSIYIASLEGTDEKLLLTIADTQGGIAIENGGEKVYWIERSRGRIWRANLDGTEVEEVLVGLKNPTRLTFVDLTPKATGNEHHEYQSALINFANYPNPFSEETTISFKLDRPGKVSLIIYDTLGRKIKHLIKREEMVSGTFEIQFVPGKIPNGVYFYQIQTANFSQIRSMVFMR